jgi:5-methylcytosine-specific restriction endonuclease McrA
MVGPKRRPGGTRKWAKMSKEAAEREPICWLRLPGCTIRSTGGDHFHPVKTHPHLEFEPRNHRGACHHCNTARGATPVHELPILRAKMERMSKYRPRKPPGALGFFE